MAKIGVIRTNRFQKAPTSFGTLLSLLVFSVVRFSLAAPVIGLCLGLVMRSILS